MDSGALNRDAKHQNEAVAFQNVRRVTHVASLKTSPVERAQPKLNELAQEAPPRNGCYMDAAGR
jgi:hypothetical protein